MSKQIYLQCECHSANHFVLIERDEFKCLQISVVADRNRSIWHRMRWAFHHIFSREDLVMADLILAPDKAKELAEQLIGWGHN